MGILMQHCERVLALELPLVSHTLIEEYLNYPRRYGWAALDAQYTLRMHNMMTRQQLLDAMLDEP